MSSNDELKPLSERVRNIKMAFAYYDDRRDDVETLADEVAALESRLKAAEATEHPDDDAVNVFSRAMKKKLAAKRGQGYGGWQNCKSDDIAKMLIEHVAKGDPVDVANFAMFLWHININRENK